jgi:hypothetical protein
LLALGRRTLPGSPEPARPFMTSALIEWSEMHSESPRQPAVWIARVPESANTLARFSLPRFFLPGATKAVGDG